MAGEGTPTIVEGRAGLKGSGGMSVYDKPSFQLNSYLRRAGNSFAR